MKYLLVLTLISILTTSALARDSTWKMCIGSTQLFDEPANLAVNVFEHRNSTGDGRVTELTMIYGGHVLQGEFDSTEDDSGKILLKQNDSTFTGITKVDYERDLLILIGKLNLGIKTDVTAVLKCENLAD